MRCDRDQPLMVCWGNEARLSTWSRRRITHFGAPLMPFALEWASSHVGSKWYTFDSWTLLGGCFVHHVLADSNSECWATSGRKSMVGRRRGIVWYARLGSRMRGDGKFRGGGIL